MSKVIIEMEMPHSCFDCPCHNGEGGLCKVDKYHRYIYNDIPLWCPIKGVLPEEHGDLIDRTSLYADVVGVILSHSGLNFIEVLARQKAVIAAERKEE